MMRFILAIVAMMLSQPAIAQQTASKVLVVDLGTVVASSKAGQQARAHLQAKPDEALQKRLTDQIVQAALVAMQSVMQERDADVVLSQSSAFKVRASVEITQDVIRKVDAALPSLRIP